MDKVQKMHFEMLKTLNFPTISGEQIVADLFAHPDIWSAVSLEFKWHIAPKYKPSLSWEFWSLYIFTIPGLEDELYRLAESWNPDNLDFMSETQVEKRK